MASDNADMFNSADYSDMLVTLTTESSEECRARLEGLGTDPLLLSSSRPSTRASSAANTASAANASPTEASPSPPHQWEDINGHKFVLCRKSEFFKSACGFQVAAGSQDRATKRPRIGNVGDAADGPSRDVIIFDCLTPAELPIARVMIQSMYTNQLPADAAVSEVIRLYHMGDKYLIANLRVLCLQRLAAVPKLTEYNIEDQHQLLLMVDTIQGIAGADGPLGAAAAAVVALALAHVQQLELLWEDERNHEVLNHLPQSFVVQVLQSKDLAVRGEGTSLVVALSWLRAEKAHWRMGLGDNASANSNNTSDPDSDADADTDSHSTSAQRGQQLTGERAKRHKERKEVLESVRLLRLEPWWLSEVLLRNAPEAQELLDPQDLALLRQYHMYSISMRQEIRKEYRNFRRWAIQRKGCQPAPAMVAVSLDKAEVLAAISDVRASRTELFIEHYEEAFSAGLWYKVGFTAKLLMQEEHVSIRLWGGLIARLSIDGVDLAADDCAHWPCSYSRRWGSSAKVHHRQVAFAKLGEGLGHFNDKKVAHDTNIEQVLQDCSVGNKLMFTAELAIPVW